MFRQIVVAGVVLPIVTAAVVLLAAWRPWQAVPSEPRGGWAGAPALALGFAAGQVGVLGWPPFPPIDAGHWTFFAALVAAALGPALDGPRAVHVRVTAVVPIVLILALVLLVIRPMRDNVWSSFAGFLWMAGLTMLALLFRAYLERVVETLPPVSGWLVLTLLAAGASAAFALTGSLALGQLAGALAAAAGAAFVLSLRTGVRPASTAATAAAVVLTGLLLSGYFYSELPAVSALLLVAAPLAPVVLPRSLTRDRAAWLAALVHAGAVAVPIAIALLIAWRNAPPLQGYY